MFLEFMTPEVFDALVVAAVAGGLAIAWRRFRQDLRKPPPEEAPDWARRQEVAAGERSPTQQS